MGIVISKFTGAKTILSIDPKLFILFKGCQLINDSSDIYVILKKYDGTCKNEVSALIGIPFKYFSDCDSLLNILRKSKSLENIPGINELAFYKLNVLKYVEKYMDDDSLILFTIEPSGIAPDGREYKTANLCLPGGGLELSDKNLIECARRELFEETGINIPRKTYISLTKQYFNIRSSNKLTKYFVVDFSDLYYIEH